MVFTPENSRIPDRNVLSLAMDSSGVLWIGTRYEGMASFDGVRWYHLRPPLSYPQTGPEPAVMAKTLGPQAEAIYDIAIDNRGVKWIGTKVAGVKRFDGLNWTIFNRQNSPLPDDYTWSILPEPGGTLWIGTKYAGLVAFDGHRWSVFAQGNSPLPSNDVTCLALHRDGSLWVGTTQGIAVRRGQAWTVYSSNNSGLPVGHVEAIAFDPEGTAWIATWGAGLVRFDGTHWTTYGTRNSGLPDDYIYSLSVEADGTVWAGTFTRGVAAFDGLTWKHFSPSNSPLPDAFVYDILVDRRGNKWFATTLGLAAYRKGGVLLGPPLLPRTAGLVELGRPYPNPSSGRTGLPLRLSAPALVTLSVYDSHGRLVRRVLSGAQLFAGELELTWDGRDEAGRRVPPGLYVAVAQAGGARSTARIVLVR